MSVIIDIHCHLLNADAVEIDSFVDAYMGSRLPVTGELRRTVLQLLQWIIRTLTQQDRRARDARRVSLASLLPSLPELGELVEVAAWFDPSTLAALLEVAESPAAEAALPDALARRLDGIPGLVESVRQFIEFAKVFTRSPRRIVDLLRKTYKPEKVDLFVPLMTDYEAWLAGEVPRGIEPRIELKKAVIARHQGQIHLFAPFCPLRAAADGTGSEVDRVLALVQNHGFLGVKLYPIMGYYPCDNATRSRPEWLPDEYRQLGVTWRDVDAALWALYGLCASQGIPITAHASPAGARGPHGPDPADAEPNRPRFFGTANQSHPLHWEPVLQRHPQLRLCLAHMGGDHFQTLQPHEKDTELDWARQTTRLMERFEHVYGDRSCQMPPDADSPQALPYAERLREVVSHHPSVADRMMNGSDWHLVVMYGRDYDATFGRFRRLCEGAGFPPRFRERFFGLNAVRFLGIGSGSPSENPNRARLNAFYQRVQGSARPPWWSNV